MPQKHQAQATNSCGTCPIFCGMCHNFSGHVPQIFRACGTTFCGMCDNFLGHVPHFSRHVPQLFKACATTFQGMCRNFSGHEPQLFKARATCLIICGIRPTFCGTCPIFCGMWHIGYYPSSRLFCYLGSFAIFSFCNLLYLCSKFHVYYYPVVDYI